MITSLYIFFLYLTGKKKMQTIFNSTEREVHLSLIACVNVYMHIRLCWYAYIYLCVRMF